MIITIVTIYRPCKHVCYPFRRPLPGFLRVLDPLSLKPPQGEALALQRLYVSVADSPNGELSSLGELRAKSFKAVGFKTAAHNLIYIYT